MIEKMGTNEIMLAFCIR